MLKSLIGEAESRFGLRAFPRSWLSVALIDEGSPRACMIEGGRFCFVLVGQDLIDDPETLTYQLAHEALHCLGSCVDTTALEEGLATHYGLENGHVPRSRSATQRARLDPERAGYLKDVKALLAVDPGMIAKIRRSPVPFEAILPQDLVAHGSPADLAARLCRPTGS